MIDADHADRLVGAWLLGLVRCGRMTAGQAGSVLMIALDGKVLRGAWEELPDVKVKLFSALHGEGVIVGQRKVPEDTTEVTQVIPLVDDIAAACPQGDPSGLVFTADALHVHRDNLTQIVERAGHAARSGTAIQASASAPDAAGRCG